MTKIDVLDKGYVRYIKHMGDDLDVVNSARVSFQKESAEFENRDDKLVKFLIDRNEFSPFRHQVVSFEVYAPLMVARQWFKYVVASHHAEDQFGWNESSRRYVTEEPEFYIPSADKWRGAPEDKKQGSAGFLPATLEDGLVPLERAWDYGWSYTDALDDLCDQGLGLYNYAIEHGVAPEQARLFLPAYGMLVRWRWTASLNAILHFMTERLANKAQSEIREYAQAVHDIVEPLFPSTTKWWEDVRSHS